MNFKKYYADSPEKHLTETLSPFVSPPVNLLDLALGWPEMTSRHNHTPLQVETQNIQYCLRYQRKEQSSKNYLSMKKDHSRIHLQHFHSFRPSFVELGGDSFREMLQLGFEGDVTCGDSRGETLKSDHAGREIFR